MIKVVHATAAGKGVPVSVASGAVRAVLRSNASQFVAFWYLVKQYLIFFGVDNFQGTVLPVTPQMLQSLGRVARAPGPRAVTPGQIVAVPVANNGTSLTARNVQMPVVPVVLSTPQRLNQQQQQQQQLQQQQQQAKNFISPILDHSGSRKRQDPDNDHGSEG